MAYVTASRATRLRADRLRALAGAGARGGRVRLDVRAFLTNLEYCTRFSIPAVRRHRRALTRAARRLKAEMPDGRDGSALASEDMLKRLTMRPLKALCAAHSVDHRGGAETFPN